MTSKYNNPFSSDSQKLQFREFLPLERRYTGTCAFEIELFSFISWNTNEYIRWEYYDGPLILFSVLSSNKTETRRMDKFD